MDNSMVTLGELAAVIVAALGGREGVKYIITKRKQVNGNNDTKRYISRNECYKLHAQNVSKEFCEERHKSLKELVTVKIDAVDEKLDSIIGELRTLNHKR